jgi:putative heme-binding domain-containing protein
LISVVWLAIFLVSAGSALSQDRARNPREGDAAAISAGAALFQTGCAECHGANAKGVVGPDLTGLWTSGAGEARVFRIIRAGVPGSVMPPNSAPDDDLWAIVAYVRSISTTVAVESASGNADQGQQLFWSTCGGCHRVNGRGGQIGPDLSRVGESQSREVLTRAIRDANASIPAGYQPVTLVTPEGKQIRGVRKSEDAFSIQIMDTRERLQGYLKASLRDVIRETRSLMPDFGADRLSDRDLDDLLAFLGTLRAAGSGSGRGRGR